MGQPRSLVPVMVFLAGLLLLLPGRVFAHCDTMNGPVVKAAQKSLETGDIRYALIWVQKKDEPEIRALFEKTLKVRALGKDAEQLADRYFFENLVRIHRAGEGEPFTGLKEGDSIDPGIAAADKAIESGSVKELNQHLSNALQEELGKSFQRVMETKKTASEGLEAGREYVAAYVRYIHQVETIHQAVMPLKEGKEVEVGMHGH